VKGGNTMRLLYINENDFNKKLRSLKTYCPIAYKQLIFKVKKELDASVPDGIYRRELKASKEFKFVYGTIELVYRVYKGEIIMENIEPSQFLLDGYMSSLDTYKGICYRDNKDKFKIDLIMQMKRKDYAI
jgi:hypothetical protein